jgi:hypothetical protein
LVAPSRLLLSSSLVGEVRVEREHSVLGHCLRTRVCAHATRVSCSLPTFKALHRASPAAPSVCETMSLGMSKRDQRCSAQAFVDLTVTLTIKEARMLRTRARARRDSRRRRVRTLSSPPSLDSYTGDAVRCDCGWPCLQYSRLTMYTSATSHTLTAPLSHALSLTHMCAHVHAQARVRANTDGISHERHKHTQTHTHENTKLPTCAHTHMNTHEHTAASPPVLGPVVDMPNRINQTTGK